MASQAEKTVSHCIALLREAGLRVTPQRTDIIRLMAGRARRYSVQEVHRSLSKKHPGLSLDTVYRTLNTLARLDIVSRVNLQNTEVVQYEFQDPGHHHHHAICMECGKSICLDECPLPAAFFDSLRRMKFQPEHHAFEVYGRCAACA
ncbi:MAG: transcriptional repressor [Leptospiraceae bacterium]|nr:transcriptional repressor [Leptospiraceae bacterium]